MSEFTPVQTPGERTAAAATNGWRELLELNLGRRITAEFFPEGGRSVVKTGTLYAVQPEYFLLTDDYGNYVVSGFESLYFITFCPNCVPADGTPQPREMMPPAAGDDAHREAGHSSQGTTEDLPSDEIAAEKVSAPVSQRGGTTASMAALNYAKRKARRLD
ncbi:MAG: hypothetical protein E7331_11990 [Clostridiales bacterium]|nr:hypothetical protein [Clostridiales bacterium]